MKVLVINNAVPFIWGEAEELARNLVLALNATKGVSAERARAVQLGAERAACGRDRPQSGHACSQCRPRHRA